MRAHSYHSGTQPRHRPACPAQPRTLAPSRRSTRAMVAATEPVTAPGALTDEQVKEVRGVALQKGR